MLALYDFISNCRFERKITEGTFITLKVSRGIPKVIYNLVQWQIRKIQGAGDIFFKTEHKNLQCVFMSKFYTNIKSSDF